MINTGVEPDKSDKLMQLLDGIEGYLQQAFELRHELHRNPSLSGEEGPTTERILASLGISDYQEVADTGLLVRVGPKAGPAVAIRAETDALPIRETSGAPFSSQNDNMHACGHDIHMAAAVLLARAAMHIELPVALLFIFQPREEAYPSGAQDIVQSGLLEQHSVRSVVGVHVHPNVPHGSITTGAGIVNAAADEFSISITGDGGHAAYPHMTGDTITTLAQIISSAQTIISRRVDPMNPAVLSFASLKSGSAANVMPGMASAAGSIRSSNHEDRELIEQTLGDFVRLIAQSNDCTGTLEVTKGEPVLSNDPKVVSSVDPVLKANGFPVVEPMRSCGADDFSFYSDQVPGVMMFLGVGSTAGASSLHHPNFCPEDETVHTAARAMACAYMAIAQSPIISP